MTDAAASAPPRGLAGSHESIERPMALSRLGTPGGEVQVRDFNIDCLLLVFGRIGGSDRLVSTSVLIALTSATTVQLGTIVILMGKYLFPAQP